MNFLIEQIKILKTLNGEGHYLPLGLFGILIYVLFFTGMKFKTSRSRKMEIISVGFILLVPLLFFCLGIFHVLDYKWMSWYFPTAIFAALGSSILIFQQKTTKNRMLLFIGICILIGLAGNPLIYNSEQGSSALENMDTIAAPVFQLIENEMPESDQIKILFPDELLIFARIYSTKFILPYGKDISDASIAEGIHDYNSDEMQQLHLWMQEQENYLSEIFETCQRLDLDFIVLPDTTGLESGTWIYNEDGSKYLLQDDSRDTMNESYVQNAVDTGKEYGYMKMAQVSSYLIFSVQE